MPTLPVDILGIFGFMSYMFTLVVVTYFVGPCELPFSDISLLVIVSKDRASSYLVYTEL